ncbi:GrpB family protein [Paenibacillus marchantiophytorum]|uniref:GrpB family protein n=1 Tax=Paenibacillus marchantiophytorum TaxID=1619310 RepID=UPI00357176F6
MGSTSIVGLPSKLILDIAVGVNYLDEADLFIEPLRKLGYEYVPKVDFPNRRFFRKGEWRKGTHHLHVYELSSDEWNNNLLFRNYLRSHPEKLVEYAQLKKHLASLYLEDRTTYTQQKAPFIQSVIELAKKLTRNKS